MKQFLLTLAGVFAGLTLFFIGVPFLLISIALGGARAPTTPAVSALVLDLRGTLTDQEPETLLSAFGQHPRSVMRIVETLKRAETDPRVKALFVRLPDGGIDPGEADELGLALRAFHGSGKPVIAFSQGLYPEGVVTSTYMLGAAADQFWMQPGAPFQATGIANESLFFKRLFDKYGVKADFEQRYEYKTAVNSYLYDDFTPAQRVADLSWMGSVYDSALSAAAGYRKMDPARLKALIEGGPYDASDAQAKGLIDRLGDLKAAEDEAAQRAAGDGGQAVRLRRLRLGDRSQRRGLRPTADRHRLRRGRHHDRLGRRDAWRAGHQRRRGRERPLRRGAGQCDQGGRFPPQLAGRR